MIKVLLPKTAEEVVAREKERTIMTTLLMALPEDHLAKFHKMADAKEMWEAIKSRFYGFSYSWFGFIQVSYHSYQGVVDPYQRDSQVVVMIFMRIKKFHKRTRRKMQFDTRDTDGVDKTKVECFNCNKMGHFARDCKAKGNQDSRRRDECNLENTPVSDRFAKGMHTVPPPMTGNYMPSRPNVEIDYSTFTYGLKQTSVDELDSKPDEYASSDLDSSVETTTSMSALVEDAPKVVNEPKVWNDVPIIEEYESDSDDDSVSNL
nr:ribonuclease H-like domain-containing protein [Tanacetum cinerariifolium]